MSEYIISDEQLGLIRDFATVCVEGEKLPRIVRCRDCAAYDGEGYGCSYGRGDDPDGFCAWGESAWITCKCGEDIERHDRIQTCPSCGRRLMA